MILYTPKNYNELIEFFNDAGNKYYESKNVLDNRTQAMKQVQLQKSNYINQEQVAKLIVYLLQNCYNLFDADF